MDISVLYQDNDLIICEKPAGIPSESPGLPDLISAQTGRKAFPVHRLDQGTGGVCILAFSPAVCTQLQKLFQQEQVQKEYLAVVSGIPEASSGIYEDLLFHDRKKNKTYIVNRIRSGVKKAVCEWTLLETVSHEDLMFSLVRVHLHTGRTHQIRVQFGSRGFPLAGDRRYGSRIKADFPALWAARISFPHPSFPDRIIAADSSPLPVFPWTLFPGR